MTTLALLLIAAIVLVFLLLPAVLMTLAMRSRTAAAVLAGILGVTFLLLIGAVGWVGVYRFSTADVAGVADVAESKTTGVEFGPPGEYRSVPNPMPEPRPPNPFAPEPSIPAEPAPTDAVPPDTGDEAATEPSAAAQSAVPAQSVGPSQPAVPNQSVGTSQSSVPAESPVPAQSVGLRQSALAAEAATSTPAAAPIRSPTPIATAAQSSPPAWAYQRAARVDSEYRVPIRVGPYTTPLECEQNLLSAVHQAVDEYVALYLGEEARGRVRLPRAFIEERLIRERWYENRPFLVTSTERADMTFLHALLVFDGDTNDYLQSLWRSAVSLYRVGVFAAAFAGVLWLLTVAWSYLKLDQISAGRYRGRLRAVAAIAVILPPLLLALLLGFGESLGFGEMPALVLSFAAGA